MSGKRANGEGSIYFDGDRDRWVAAVTIGRDPKTGRLIRRKVSGKTKSAAVAAKAALLAKYKDTYYIDADKLTVGEWMDKYLTTYKKGSVRQNTYESYRAIASTYIMPRLGNIVLDKLLPLQVQQMVTDITATQSPRTAEYALVVLRMASRRALDEGIIARDPTRGVRRAYKSKRDIKTITAADLVVLLEHIPTPAMRLAVKIMYATGLRTEEMLALTWNNADIDNCTITINQVAINTRAGAQIAAPKTRSSIRTVTLPPKLAANLRSYRKHQAAQIIQSTQYTNHNYIICNDDGSLILPRNYGKRFALRARIAGLDITAHCLRHTHATQLFAAGWHAKDVQERLGHSSITITLDTYTHYIPNRANDIAVYIDQIYPDTLL